MPYYKPVFDAFREVEGSASSRRAAESLFISAIKRTSALANSCSTKRFTRSPLCWTSGTNRQRRISKSRAQRARPTCSYDEQADEWTLQSGFDGDELLARPSIELIT